MLHAASSTVPPGPTPLSGIIAGLGRSVADCFEITSPAERERLSHRMLLVAILCVGTIVRFWGLGSVGLHGDEETMAMAAMHILENGLPILPSGMLYPRGLTETYLMALSVWIFGESEWAFRLPSAVCGVALIALAWLAGRRFLRPQWNLAFAAVIALLPDLIEFSQTARMYIFLLASIAACMICIFAWERTGRMGWLAGAVLALVVGIELHALAVTCVLLFALPGMLQGDTRKLVHGAAAAVIVMLAYLGIDAWVNAQYPVPPPEYVADLGPPPWMRGRASQGFDRATDIALWIGALVVAVFAFRLGRLIAPRAASIGVVVLLLAGLLSQLMLFYHLAALLFLAAAVLAWRHGEPGIWRWLSVFALGSVLFALVHVSLLASNPGSLLKLAGALVGRPSVWPYFRIMAFSPVAGALALLALAWGLVRFALRRPIADYWLLAILGVWIPLFTIGLFVWNAPPRYTAASLLPLLLSALAFAQGASDWLIPKLAKLGTSRTLQATAAFLAAGLMINPAASAAAIGSGYATHPDHKGAADFMRAQNIVPEDIILAEDVLQQTYYLGSVDYWLLSRWHARRYVELVEGRIRDFYTATAVIGSGKEFEELLRQNAGRRIFVIGSGENQADGRRQMRGLGICEVLYSDRFEVIYTGRDGTTKVWRAVPQQLSLPGRQQSVPAVSARVVRPVSVTLASPCEAPAAPPG